MRWLWRLSVLVLLLLLVNNSNKDINEIYINLTTKMEHWQKVVQDLPANIEVEIWKIWDGAKPKGSAKAI